MEIEKDKPRNAPESAAEAALVEKKLAYSYIRAKVNQLLRVIGTKPLADEELDDQTLLQIDPIGIVAESFEQILQNLQESNQKINAAHEELKVAHDDLQAVFDAVDVAILVLNPDMTVRAHNKAVADKMSGGEPCIGAYCHDVICKTSTPPSYCTLKAALDAKNTVHKKRISIGEKIYDVAATPLYVGGDLEHVILAYHDVTERQEMMDKLMASEARYRDLFENSNDLILAAGDDGKILYANSAFTSTLGYTDAEVRALGMKGMVESESRAKFADSLNRMFAGEYSQTKLETTFVSRDGRHILVEGDITSSPGPGTGKKLVRAIFRDVTESRRLQQEMSKVQRLETVGLLAGGIAHDFNNVLTSVMGNISMAAINVQNGQNPLPNMEKAERAILRARSLTQQLLTFSRGGAPVKKQFRLDLLVRETVEFALAGTPVNLQIPDPAEELTVIGDPGQIEQVIHNITANAVQAMPSGGTFFVTYKSITAKDAAAHLLSSDTAHVALSFQDTGPGIPEDALPHIFDPFFTTRPGGTGLGLATAYSIIKNHDGQIEAANHPGGGALLTIYLPAVKARGTEAAISRAARKLSEGTGRILIMDDDADIRDLLTSLLTTLGYDAVAAPDGMDALRLYETGLTTSPFDIVITDLTVPGGMGGLELIVKLKKIDPNVVAVVSSGYSNEVAMGNFAKYGFSGALAKPYRLDVLSELLARLMESNKKKKAGA